jgi:hypothetical protein
MRYSPPLNHPPPSPSPRLYIHFVKTTSFSLFFSNNSDSAVRDIMADTQDMPVHRADDVAAKRDKDHLLDHLDDLLERYLHTLHEYQQVMQQVSKHMSNVRLSSDMDYD